MPTRKKIPLIASDANLNVTGDVEIAGSGSAVITFPSATSTLATLTGTETLTNKTLTSPKINEDLALTSTATELNLLTGITTLSGSNTGDQTSIVGITGTKSQFDTAVTDGNIMYDGDAVTNLNASQTDVLVGRDTAGAGALEELSPATVRTLLNVEDGATADQSDAEIETAINNQLTGTVVGTSDTQTLTNKTIDADNNTVSNLAHGAEVDNPTSGVHGATGSIVGTTDAQTLTNKTLTAPAISNPTGLDILDISNPYKARAYRSGSQTIGNESITKIQFNAETYDVNGDFDSTTNYRFVAPVDGYYQVNAAAAIQALGDGKLFYVYIRKNDTVHSQVLTSAGVSMTKSAFLSDVIYLEATQYVELFCYHNHGSDRSIDGDPASTYMSVHLLSI
jgi:hypothetical protein